MTITSEKSLTEFKFWSGAEERAKLLTDDELDQIESMLEEANPDGMSETEINDFFWFEFDTVAEWLGYEKEEDILMRDNIHMMLDRASELIDEIRDEIVPEFDENDLKEYFERTGSDMEMFLYKDDFKNYIAEISDCTVEEAEANDYFTDYEDTLRYLHLGVIQKEIANNRDLSSEDLDILRNTVSDVLRKDGQDLSFDRSELCEKIADMIEEFEIERDEIERD